MISTYAPIASALLRGMTDNIAQNATPLTGRESLTELIAHVQQVSHAAQSQMRSALRAAFPEIAWVDSEDKRDSAAGDAPYWVYDPIDGAYHYLQGLPLWSSSLALMRNGHPVLAFVYDPTLNELFAAEVGAGATLNGQSVNASAKTDLRAAVAGSALVPVAGATADEHAFNAALLIETAKHVFVVRPLAAASLQLAYVAAGRLDAYVEPGDDVYDWMAGSLLVRGAAGTVSALDGGVFDPAAEGILAAGVALHAPLSDRLSRHFRGAGA